MEILTRFKTLRILFYSEWENLQKSWKNWNFSGVVSKIVLQENGNGEITLCNKKYPENTGHKCILFCFLLCKILERDYNRHNPMCLCNIACLITNQFVKPERRIWEINTISSTDDHTRWKIFSNSPGIQLWSV